MYDKIHYKLKKKKRNPQKKNKNKNREKKINASQFLNYFWSISRTLNLSKNIFPQSHSYFLGRKSAHFLTAPDHFLIDNFFLYVFSLSFFLFPHFGLYVLHFNVFALLFAFCLGCTLELPGKLFIYYLVILAVLWGMWDHSSQVGVEPVSSALEALSLNW